MSIATTRDTGCGPKVLRITTLVVLIATLSVAHHAQAQLFQQVLRKACADASDVSYIEMHGTATQVGDLAEMTAVANTFGRHRKSGQLRVGAVKANIGHSEAVSA